MTMLRLTSIDAPFDRPELRAAAMTLVKRAIGVGLLPDRAPISRLDLDLIKDIARQASSVGVGQDSAVVLATVKSSSWAQIEALMNQLDGALAQSPIPDHEVRELVRLYDLEPLASLVGSSSVSLRRYTNGERTMPDTVAARLHFVAMVTSDLIGSYNDIGIRRWWERPRALLDGQSPSAALGTGWSPDDPQAKAVADLAAALSGATAAS
jgi:hypothetical protein